MKTLILTAALPLLACAARAQDAPHDDGTPAETVKKAGDAAWLGIVMTERHDRVVVSQIVPGSPAEKAGLKEGDRILRVGDAVIEGRMQQVVEKIGQQKPGDSIELRYLRDDKEDAVKIELAERPAELHGDFRGEFRREEKQVVPAPRGKIVDREGHPIEPGRLLEGRGRTLGETKRAIEDVKDELKNAAGELRLEYKLVEDKYKLMEDIGKKAEAGQDKLESGVELDPYKKPGDPDLFMELPRLPGKAFGADTGKLLRYYLDREWSSDKAEGKSDDWDLRLGLELPHYKWAEQNKKAAGKRQKPGDDFNPLLRFTIPHPWQEAAIWKRVQESIAHSLKRSGVGPDMVEKVMNAVEEARRADIEKGSRRAKLEAEAAKLEKEMQSLKQRADKVREELKKATE